MTAAIPQSDDFVKQIDTTLALAKGEKVNICYALLKIIESAPEQDQPALLRHTTESYESAGSSQEISIDDYITKNEESAIRKKYGGLINNMLEVLIEENREESEFYAHLWSLINNPILRDDKDRAFALYWLLIDKRLPYFRLEEGFKMSNEDYRSSMLRLRRDRARIRFIMSREFDQKTERADLILKQIDEASGSDRVILMSEVIKQTKSSSEGIEAMLRDML